MFTDTNMDRFHRIVVVACLVIAPLLLAVGMLVHPGEDDGGLAETLVSHPGRMEAANLLIIFSSLMFVPALLGILRYVPGRGTILTHIGVGLALTGVIGHAVWAGFQIVLLGLAQSGVDRTQLSTLVEGNPPNPAFVIVMLMFLVGFFLGLILLAGGLWRSRTFPKWASVGIGVIALFDFVPLDNGAVFVIGPLVLIASFGAIALTLLRMPGTAYVPAGGSVPGTGAESGMQPQVQ